MKKGKLKFIPEGDSGGELAGYSIIPDNFSEKLAHYFKGNSNISILEDLTNNAEVFVDLVPGFKRARIILDTTRLTLVSEGKLPIIIKGVGEYDVWGSAEIFEEEYLED